MADRLSWSTEGSIVPLFTYLCHRLKKRPRMMHRMRYIIGFNYLLHRITTNFKKQQAIRNLMYIGPCIIVIVEE